jgi:hypothetical protein
MVDGDLKGEPRRHKIADVRVRALRDNGLRRSKVDAIDEGTSWKTDGSPASSK